MAKEEEAKPPAEEVAKEEDQPKELSRKVKGKKGKRSSFSLSVN